MKTMIHKSSQTVAGKVFGRKNVPPFESIADSQKLLDTSRTFSQREVLAMLNALNPGVDVQTQVVSGLIAKAPKAPSKKPSKPKQLVIKLYNSKTNAHEEMSLDAQEYCDMKLYEVIEAIRSEGFSADAWSFKIRIPAGL